MFPTNVNIQPYLKIFSDMHCIISHGSHSVFKHYNPFQVFPWVEPKSILLYRVNLILFCMNILEMFEESWLYDRSRFSATSARLTQPLLFFIWCGFSPLPRLDTRWMIQLRLILRLPVCPFFSCSLSFARLCSSKWSLTSRKWIYKTEACT